MKNFITLVLLSFSTFVSAGFLVPSEDELNSPQELRGKSTTLSHEFLETFEEHARMVLKDSYNNGSMGIILYYLERILNTAQTLNNRVSKDIDSRVDFGSKMSGKDLSDWLSRTGLNLLEDNLKKIGWNFYFETADEWIQLRLQVIEKIENEKEEESKSKKEEEQEIQDTLESVVTPEKYKLKEELIHSHQLIKDALKAHEDWKQVIQVNLDKIRQTDRNSLETASHALVNIKSAVENSDLNAKTQTAINFVKQLVDEYQMPLSMGGMKKVLAHGIEMRNTQQ